MRKAHFIFLVASITLTLLACNSGDKEKNEDSEKETATFDMQKARALIDSINAKWTQEIKNGDSVAIASHYGPDAVLLLSNNEPISGKAILSTWSGIIRAGMTDWKFATTNLEGDANFLIETGTYEINDAGKKSLDKGNYVVIWKQQNGEWKVFRDVGVTSVPAQPLH
jgi:ketosteroid isomerase-like protein